MTRSEYMWQMCDDALAVANDPERRQAFFRDLVLNVDTKAAMLVYAEMARIPADERGDWFTMALPIAMRYVTNGARRWIQLLHDSIEDEMEGRGIPVT